MFFFRSWYIINVINYQTVRIWVRARGGASLYKTSCFLWGQVLWHPHYIIVLKINLFNYCLLIFAIYICHKNQNQWCHLSGCRNTLLCINLFTIFRCNGYKILQAIVLATFGLMTNDPFNIILIIKIPIANSNFH